MRRIFISTLTALALAAGVAGCTSHHHGPSVASANGPARGASATPSPSTSVDPATAALHYAQCMRDHGVDVPDPSTENGGTKILMPGNGANLKNDPKFQAAQQACQQYLPNGGAPPSLSPDQLAQMRAWAQCMRDHGVQIADPDPNAGGALISGDDGSKVDMLNDPTFKAAQAACGTPGGKTGNVISGGSAG